MTCRARTALALVALLGGVAGPAAAQWQAGTVRVVPFGSLRVRGEDWRWFRSAQPVLSSYAFGNALGRLGVQAGRGRLEATVELAAPMLIGLEQNVVAPMPQGPLGIGGAYRLASGTANTDIFVKQAYAAVRLGSAARAGRVRAGRMQWSEGRERVVEDPALAQLKAERVAERLIGSFAFTVAGRSVDGLVAEVPIGSVQLSLAAVRPTAGVFQLDGSGRLPVDLAYGALSLPLAGRAARSDAGLVAEARAFGIWLRDERGVALADNRVLAGRPADHGVPAFGTFGGHLLARGPVGAVRLDGMAWGAFQRGRFGAVAARGWAVTGEVGAQFVTLPARPWVRVGWFHSSGDDDPQDQVTATFQGLMPSPRIYARVPFVNLMNVDDRFVQLVAQPHARLRLRSDLHLLALSSGRDLWYAGGGAYNLLSYGNLARHAGGHTGLGRLVDLSADLQLGRGATLSGYVGHVVGGAAIAHVHPGGANATFLFVELTRQF